MEYRCAFFSNKSHFSPCVTLKREREFVLARTQHLIINHKHALQGAHYLRRNTKRTIGKHTQKCSKDNTLLRPKEHLSSTSRMHHWCNMENKNVTENSKKTPTTRKKKISFPSESDSFSPCPPHLTFDMPHAPPLSFNTKTPKQARSAGTPKKSHP